MRHELSFRFDRRFIHDGLKRDHVWQAWFTFACVTIASIALMFWFVVTESGGWPQWVGCALGPPLGALIGWDNYRRTVTRTLAVWENRSPSGVIVFRALTVALEVSTDYGVERFRWDGLRRLWRYDDVWLFEFLAMQSVLFPCREAPAAMLEDITKACQDAGVTVDP